MSESRKFNIIAPALIAAFLIILPWSSFTTGLRIGIFAFYMAITTIFNYIIARAFFADFLAERDFLIGIAIVTFVLMAIDFAVSFIIDYIFYFMVF